MQNRSDKQDFNPSLINDQRFKKSATAVYLLGLVIKNVPLLIQPNCIENLNLRFTMMAYIKSNSQTELHKNSLKYSL